MGKNREVDFLVADMDSFCLLHVNTNRASKWVEKNLVGDITQYGGSIVVEENYIQDICCGIINKGLSIQKDGMIMYINEDGGLYLR